MNNKSRAILFFVVIVIFFTVSGLSCRKEASNKTSNSFRDFSIPDVLVADQLFSYSVAEAQQKAQEWKPDAYLVVVDIFFDGTKISSADKPIAYFQSYQDNNENNYAVTLQTDFGEIIQTDVLPIQKTDQIDNYEILSHEWQIGYAEALKIADDDRGAFFRSQHPGFGIVVELYKSSGTGLEWGVFYSGINSSNTKDTLTYYIDAIDGSIKKIE